MHVLRNSLKLLEKVKMKKYLFFLFLMAIITSILETLSIGAILPMMQFIFNSDQIFFINSDNFPFLKDKTENDILILMIIIIVVIFFIKNIFIFLNNYFQLNYVFNFQIKITSKLLESYSNLKYESYILKNTSYYIKNLTLEVIALTPFFTQLLIMTSEIIILIAITSFLFWINFKLSLVLIIIFGFSAGIYLLIVRKKMRIWGTAREKYDTLRVKDLNHIFGLFKEIKSTKIKKFFFEIFSFNNKMRYSADLKETLINSFPRVYLEMVFIITILSITIFLLYGKNMSDAYEIMPFIGLFAVYSIRLIPSINKIIYAYQSLKFRTVAVDLIINEINESENNVLKTNLINNNEINIKNILSLKNIHFHYKENYPVFSDLNLSIKKNSFIGIMGESGSGKSTLLGLISGLLEPNKGEVLIDDKFNISDNYLSWAKKVSSVSQNVFLLDDTIKNNIALGEKENEINYDRLNLSLEISQLKKVIKNLDNGVDSFIGERGIRLSGGQIQRIGIARALYQKSEILILDESTNALDEKTESEFLQFIHELKKSITVIFVTHKKNTLKDVDAIYEISNNKIIQIQ